MHILLSLYKARSYCISVKKKKKEKGAKQIATNLRWTMKN